MQIRPYRADDREDVLGVLRLGLEDQARFAEPSTSPDDPGFFASAWQEQVASLTTEPEHWWVAVDEAEIAGVMRLAFWIDERLGPVASVVELDVHPRSRNRGVGSRLLDHAEATARSGAVIMLFISGFSANPALRLYRRKGFVESAESLRHNEGPDHLVLGKRLKT